MMIPCIDLQDGKAVQLVHGRRRALEVADVLGLLERFRRHPWLNVIDLDAAIGTGANEEWVKKLCRAARRDYGMRVRVGGGVRTVARAKELVKLGAAQVIVGSAAFRDGAVDTRFLRRLRTAIGRRRIVVALDTLRGRIAVRGWRTRLALRPAEVMEELAPLCGGFLCTDVDREGTMSGANLKWFRELREQTSLPIIAAGGIRSRREIAALEKMGMDAAVGMALYTKRLR
ncbi:MAG: 1-(5-phosphoribosyl)-5-[(5-phosphoribosylamino)methylideneamino] imidazole-4-carboxamide isomerase [Acidobacteriia bacterium]|nr:1-(5-phosphoribosyl)-5-[(5-phosphoribosylamino)methylideneamino] imidazole-4-carboxamide isomerase [Terriglobia bacterium]